MNVEVKTLKGLLDSAKSILITSHIGPDGDSISSTLLLLKILKLNYAAKEVNAVAEERPYGLDFLDGLSEIKIQPLPDALNELIPDLLIILDANTVSRVTRHPEAARRYIKERNLKTIIIDHHEPAGIEDNELYINNSSPAVTLDIYEIFLQKLGMKKPDGYAQIAVTGIYTDTGGFVNRNLNYRKTFDVLPELIEAGADIEKVANNLSRMSGKGYGLFKLFIDNMELETEYAFTYLPDGILDSKPQTIEAVKQAADLVRSGFLRTIGQRNWGFIVYEDVLAPEHTYSVSFRAISDTRDVSAIARRLGGGGHKPAAGAKIEASSVKEAMAAVKRAIEES
jgi:phosphoesterase RecJ-like protein